MHDAAVVVDAADPRRVLHLALALAVDVLLDVLDHGEVRPGDVEAGRDVALGRVARGDRVLFRARPPDADDVVAREADLGRRLQRHGVHHAPAPQDHPVGLDLPDLQPLRALLVARVRDGDVRDREAVLLRLRVENRNGLLAVGRVVIDVHDLLALELVHPPFLRPDELDLGRVLRPVVRDQREDVREDPAVGGVGAAVADRHDGHLVGRPLLDQRIGDAGRQRVHERGAGRPLLLQALVALDAARVVVLGLALLVRELDAVHAAVARVDHVDVVDHPAEDAGPAGRVGPDPVPDHRDELLALRVRRRRGAEHREAQQGLGE